MKLISVTGSTLEPPCEQPCHIISVFNSFCELTEIVHEALYTLHCPAKTANRQDMIGVYTRFLSWYNNLPAMLRLGTNFTPQVLFMQFVLRRLRRSHTCQEY